MRTSGVLEVVMALFVIVLHTSAAMATEPFGWGTTLQAIETLAKEKCQFSLTTTTLDQEHRVSCTGYELEQLGRVDVFFDFVKDRLQHYVIIVRRPQEAALRTAAPGLVPANSVSRIDACLSGFVCLTVSPR